MHSRRSALLAGAALWGTAGCALTTEGPAAAPADAVSALRAAEQGFADTMARRDLAAFGRYVADDAVFINGGQPLRGKAAVLAHWSKFFTSSQAPFAWRPELAELAGDGSLGYTEGPVSSPAGVVFARFFSTWRREPGGVWRVVFDNGHAVCKA